MSCGEFPRLEYGEGVVEQEVVEFGETDFALFCLTFSCFTFAFLMTFWVSSRKIRSICDLYPGHSRPAFEH